MTGCPGKTGFRVSNLVYPQSRQGIRIEKIVEKA